MNIELWITNIAFAFSILVCLGLGILVFIRRSEKSSSNIVFFWASITTSIWQLSYVIGINLYDPHISQIAFTFNVVTLFIVVIFAHLMILITDRLNKINKWILKAFYTIATILVLFFALFPNYLLEPSQPKLYLPNFFVPGSLYSLQDTFFFIVFIYILFQSYMGYHHADYRMRNRLKYFIIAYLYGFGVALIPEFLLYGINIDPIFSSFTGLYTIPLAYAIIKYDVMDINLIAKKAFGYALSVTGVTLIVILIGYTNSTITHIYPSFPQWLMPLLSSAIAVMVGISVWKKIKDADNLKDQFVDVVTHKFRTPLTYINWSLNTLRDKSKPEEHEQAIANIEEANTRLFELTDTLIGISRSDRSQFIYSYSKENLSEIINETIAIVERRIQEKNIQIQNNISNSLPKIYVDRKRIQFAIQMVIENAIIYSHQNGQIILNADIKKDFIIFSVQDFGIGISKEDLSRIFSKFFRSDNAKKMHTEGLGIGLNVSHDIMLGHGGDLSVKSEGLNTGTTFQFKIPLAK